AKMGGGESSANPRLRSALTAARAVNMPNNNIERAIKKGLGELGDVVFEEILYEGYGADGVAVLIECLTDNRNRSASEVRMTLDRNCGNLATSGAVSWMFHRKAHFVITGEKADEEILMDTVLDAGAEDIEVEDGVAEIWGPPEALEAIMEALAAAGIKTEEAGIVRRPENTVTLKNVEKAQQVLRLIDRLEDLDDVQEVTANFEIDDSIADQVEID
ncbi:MAG: YebC/PmpR family DNA-binding transcriptional regulator, partial [Victivallaceae bacterium]|nr:YebC/PmpR family DNA-binding transcriptional regulator [Victivallaceae bacterium]